VKTPKPTAKAASAPRMRDVAKRCGVSESTVSHVLNGTKAVAEATRARILEAIRELNYHRDSDARRLATGRSNFLGLIISDIENPFFPGLIKSFENAALKERYEVLLCTTSYDAERTKNAFRKMVENKSPGVAVMTSRVDPQMAEYLADQGVASVFLDSGHPGRYRSNIRIDYVSGVTAAINYLYNLGHRDFALLAGPQNRASHRAYRTAVDAALATWGLTARLIEGNNDAQGSQAAVEHLLTGGRLPTAILCSNDLTAMSVIRSLFQRGIRVPADVSVVGADDIPFAALTEPPLTTVHIPRVSLGTLAFELLQEMLSESSRTGRDVTLPTSLTIRESAGVACRRSDRDSGLTG
jgi:DNA-binding LacI/PurR family transcriptional regulator